jgi:hypothetical protein
MKLATVYDIGNPRDGERRIWMLRRKNSLIPVMRMIVADTLREAIKQAGDGEWEGDLYRVERYVPS